MPRAWGRGAGGMTYGSNEWPPPSGPPNPPPPRPPQGAGGMTGGSSEWPPPSGPPNPPPPWQRQGEVPRQGQVPGGGWTVSSFDRVSMLSLGAATRVPLIAASGSAVGGCSSTSDYPDLGVMEFAPVLLVLVGFFDLLLAAVAPRGAARRLVIGGLIVIAAALVS